MNGYYTIKDICQFTGLTSRTIRNYISLGMLQGEKLDGKWQFSSDKVSKFLNDPNVWPSIQVKKNSLVSDFIMKKDKDSRQMCIILDLPEDDPKKILDIFCQEINTEKYSPQLCFSFECQKNYPRIILKGQDTDVLKLVNLFYSHL